ncbi:hypothetical protein [Gilliamella sp. App4-10]|uniref:hypothetical protein n=1 Tax=Gilliamella sp. App4-10 TaxID=3120231 RepID=UPI00080E2C8F|nr:hypothetical protein [Gilliamella apicola]OCG21208.1 hypothetical protein A9G23_05280 [Gilliamella apicola]
MIVRIELNQLEKRSNDYFYNDTPFNGEAYDHRDNQLYQVYEITDGVITGSRDYGVFEANGMIKLEQGEKENKMNEIKNKTESNPPIRVELSHLQRIDGLYFLNDVLFRGLAYDHRNN